jgi:NADH-quinone oxidoreductase subunit M
MAQHLLSLLVFLPLVALAVVLGIPATARPGVFRAVLSLITGSQLVLAAYLYWGFDPAFTGLTDPGAMAYAERLDWITLRMGGLGELSIDYFVGVDGLSMPLVLLATLVLFAGAVASHTIGRRVKGYAALYLLLSTSVVGCFVALDFFLFFLFFEFMLLPMYFLIGIWGGARREYAAIKFFLYTLVGSVCILLVMIGLYLSVADPGGIHTFDILAMTQPELFVPGSLLHPASGVRLAGLPLREVAFLLLFVGFAVKLPAVPVHTWLPDAHVEAPTPISVVLAGILLKVGAYGLLRIAYPVFPAEAAHYATLVGGLGTLSILYAALNALAADDLKRMVAYSSVSHMGFVLVGIASVTVEGVSGAVYMLFSHGVLSALLFLLVGVLYERTHDKAISNYRGLAGPMPHYTAATTVAFFASLGLPGFSGFIGEFFTLIGAFGSEAFPPWVPFGALLGLIVGAAYFLWTLQKMFFGPLWTRNAEWQGQLPDLRPGEKALLYGLGGLSLVLGLFPHLLFNKMENTLTHWVAWIVK